MQCGHCYQNQGYGAGTQVSGSGSISKHLNFLAPASERFGPKIKLLFYLYNSLAQQIMSVEREPKVQGPASEIIWLRLGLQPSKIA